MKNFTDNHLHVVRPDGSPVREALFNEITATLKCGLKQENIQDPEHSNNILKELTKEAREVLKRGEILNIRESPCNLGYALV